MAGNLTEDVPSVPDLADTRRSPSPSPCRSGPGLEEPVRFARGLDQQLSEDCS